MSQENVEIVRNAYRGLDERGVDGLLEFIHEDVEYLPVEERGGFIFELRGGRSPASAST